MKYKINFSNNISYSMILLSFVILLSIDIISIKPVSGSTFSDLPPPPVKPEKFTSKQQLKDYLVKLHEYYAIIGRPRFGRSSSLSYDNNNEQIVEPLMEQADNQILTHSNEISKKEKLVSNSRNSQNYEFENKSYNKKNNLLMSLLARKQQQNQEQQQQHQQQEDEQQSSETDQIYENENTAKYSLPTAIFLDMLDENNDGETNQDELQNFLNYFYRDSHNSKKFLNNHD